jgi:hypothetical protein
MGKRSYFGRVANMALLRLVEWGQSRVQTVEGHRKICRGLCQLRHANPFAENGRP